MNKKIEQVMQWMKERNPREKIFLFLAGLAVMYMVVNFLVFRPIELQRKESTGKLRSLQEEKETHLLKINQFLINSNSKDFIRLVDEQKQLTEQLKQLQDQLDKVTISSKALSEITNDILSQTTTNITLANLKNSSTEPWVLAGLEQTNLSKIKIYRQNMQIEFKGSYFNVVDYLARLEKLSWKIYWDSLDYKVTNYPTASVVVRFHVLSDKQS